MLRRRESHTAWWREVSALVGICPSELRRRTGHDWFTLYSLGVSPIPMALWYLTHGSHYTGFNR